MTEDMKDGAVNVKWTRHKMSYRMPFFTIENPH